MTVTPFRESLRRFALGAVAASAALAATGPASAGGNGPLRMPAENWTVPYSASATAIPACTDPSVASKISGRFADAESSYWNSNLQIVSFANVRPVAFRPWGLDYIPRLFCTGTVVTSDGRKRTISFHIGQDTGIIGATWGVDFCIQGLDRQLAYAPDCKMAQP